MCASRASRARCVCASVCVYGFTNNYNYDFPNLPPNGFLGGRLRASEGVPIKFSRPSGFSASAVSRKGGATRCECPGFTVKPSQKGTKAQRRTDSESLVI